MPFAISIASPTVPSSARLTTRARARMMLVAATGLLLVGSVSIGVLSSPSTVEPDLGRLLRFMAVLKGTFALVAFTASYWRIARPASPWREAVYLIGPGLVGAGAIGLWFLQSAGFATLLLHAGLFAYLAAALTDAEFVPTRLRRAR